LLAQISSAEDIASNLKNYLLQDVWTKRSSYFSGIFFRTNAINTSITTAKSGRIIQVGNSGMTGVGVEAAEEGAR
jgi:hypothetical protein